MGAPSRGLRARYELLHGAQGLSRKREQEMGGALGRRVALGLAVFMAGAACTMVFGLSQGRAATTAITVRSPASVSVAGETAATTDTLSVASSFALGTAADSVSLDVRIDRSFTNKVPATIVCKIRHEGLLVTVDGQQVFFRRTNTALPSTPTSWKMPDESKLFLGTQMSRYHVHKFMITPYRGP